jgi:hypothetical protein
MFPLSSTGSTLNDVLVCLARKFWLSGNPAPEHPGSADQ